MIYSSYSTNRFLSLYIATTTIINSTKLKAFTSPMAKLLLLLLLLTTITFTSSANSRHGHGRGEKLSHFSLYWHDILSGHNPTAVPIVRPPPSSSQSKTGFGGVAMIDDPLTLGPTMNSTIVGRAQGFYASAALESVGLMMAMNFVFHQGRYNGSTFTVMGRNAVFNTVREMPVVGGSGAFRFARGYVQARTHTFDIKTGDAVVHYDCFVMHY